MGRKLLDTYEKWEQQGIVRKKLKDIQDMVAKNITQKNIATYLGMSEKTLIKLKKKHKKLEEAFIFGNDELIQECFDTLYRKAMGFKETTTNRHAEDNKNGKNNKKSKVTVTEKYYPPCLSSLKYLMLLRGGKKYNERREELDLMKERIEARKEEWPDAVDN